MNGNRCFFLIFFISFFSVSFAQDVQLSVQTGHSAPISCIKFSPDQNFIASAGKDKKIILWDVRIGKQYNQLSGHDAEISAIDFINDSLLVSADLGGFIRTWNIHSGKMVNEVKHGQPVGSLDVAPGGKFLLFGSDYLHLLNLQNAKITNLKIASRKIFSVVRFNKSGDMFIAGGRGETWFYTVNVLSFDSSKFVIRKKLPASITDADFSPETNEIIYSSESGKLLAIELEKNFHKGATTDFPTNSFNAVRLSPSYIFGATRKGKVMIYDRGKWNRIPAFIDHAGSVNSLDLSADGKLLASAADDRTIIIWNTQNRKLVKKLQGLVNQVNAISFCDEGKSILIGFGNGSFRKSDLFQNTSVASQLDPSEIRKSLGWRYAVAGIKPLKGDSVWIRFYNLHASDKQNKEAFDKIEELHAYWNTSKPNELSLIPQRKENAEVKNYISRLKKNEVMPAYAIYSDSMLIASSAKLQLKANVNGDKVEISGGGKSLTIVPAHSDRISCIAFNEEYGILATGSWDGLVKLWDVKSGKLLSTYGAFGASNFIYIDNDKNYFASKGSLEYIAFRYAKRIFSFDQFDLKYNRPDKVLSALPFIEKASVDNYRKAYEKRLKKLKITEAEIKISDRLPLVQLKLPEDLISKDGEFSFNIEASDAFSQLESISVLINGVPENSRNGKKISGKTYSENVKLQLNPRNNFVQVYVTNSEGVSSLKESFSVYSEQAEEKPALYLVVIGASEYSQSQYNLKYAAKDATDISKFFSGLKQFSAVNTKILLNKDVTLAGVNDIQQFLSPAKTTDIVMVFAAGHGVLDKNFDYFFAANDMDFNDPAKKGIPYDLLDEMLDKTKSRKKIMFIDACHSGEIDKDEVKETVNQVAEGDLTFRSVGVNVKNNDKVNAFELSKSVFADFRANNGANVISSAGGAEYAMEGDQWANGLFTYVLLNGLKSKKADTNKDGKIMLSEMQRYIIKEVLRLSKGKQSPNLRNENLRGDFQIF
jgi:WD40 repeat protein